MTYKNKGFTPIPNIILNNPAVPRCCRGTYEAVSARAFGKRFSVFTSRETLAMDVGISTRTIARHLAVLEALGFIKRIRIGRGLTNTIVLTLKMRLVETGSLTKAIEAELGGLSAYVLRREKLTMKEGLKLVRGRRRRQREISLALKQAQTILKDYHSGTDQLPSQPSSFLP